MDIEYIISKLTNGANPFRIFERLPKINKEILAQKLKQLTYDQFLQTAYWFGVASKAKSLAGMRCQICNGANDLNVHHRTYDTHGYEHLFMNDLVVLDNNCHGLFHGHLEPVPKKLQAREPRIRNIVIPRFDEVAFSQMPELVCLTSELVNGFRTNGAFTNATLRALGIQPPLIRGWVSRLIGTYLPREKFKQAMLGRFQYGTGPLRKTAE